MGTCDLVNTGQMQTQAAGWHSRVLTPTGAAVGHASLYYSLVAASWPRPSGIDSLMYIDFVDFADFVVSRILCSLFDCSVLHTAHRTPHIRIAHTSSFLFPPFFYRPYLVSWGGASPDDRFEIDLHYCGSYSFCFGEVRGVLALWARRSVDYPVNYRQYTCVLCNGTPRVITPTIFFTLASRGRMVQYELCTSIIQQ